MIKKKKVVSFALDSEALDDLKRKEQYTLFIQAVVKASLGRCPVCDGRWPNKKTEETSEG